LGGVRELKSILVIGLLTLGSFSAAGADELPPYARRPNALIAEIAKRGAAQVIADPNLRASWVGVLDNISRGNRDWLLAALALLQGADGGASDDLRLAVSHALIPSADDVLDIFAGQIKAENICWATAEFGGHDTLKSAIDEAQAKIKSVEAVREPQLSRFQAECLASLRSTASELPAIYGESNP
jgi:hypothetical protein